MRARKSMKKLIAFANNLGISQKLTALVACAALGAGACVGAGVSAVVQKIIYTETERVLQEKAATSVQLISTYLYNIEQDLIQTATAPMTATILEEFNAGFNGVYGNATELLKEAYITNNPNPVGKKDKMNDAGDGSYYSQVHAQYHKYFLEQKDDRGYYDIFLMNRNGDVVYTVYKEQDFATNIETGEYADSGLGAVFKAVKDNPVRRQTVFKDFAPYAPSANAPASFIAAPVLDSADNFVGVLAFQMPVDNINALFLDPNNKTIASYIIGSDNKLRNDITATDVNDILVTESPITTAELQEGGDLRGRKGSAFAEASIGFKKFNFLGIEYTVVVEETADVINNNLTRVNFWSFLIAALSSVIIGFIGFIFARSIAGPVAGLADVVEKLSQGYKIDIPYRDKGDEVGVLARSLTVIDTQATESARVQTAVENSNAPMMIANDGGEVVYYNKAFAQIAEDCNGYFSATNGVSGLKNSKIGLLFGTKGQEIDGVLHTLRDTYECEVIAEGRRHFDTFTSAIFNASGNRIGFVSEWKEKTNAVGRVKEAEAVRQKEAEIERQVTEVITAVAQGDFSSRLNINDDRLFIQSVSGGINKICDTVERFMNELNDTMDAFSKGDLTKTLQSQYAGRFSDVKNKLNEAFGSLANTIRKIATVGNGIRAAGSDITQGAEDLSGRTEAQAAGIEETVATMEQMSASVRNNASSAVQAANLAQEALTKAEEGGNVVSKAVNAMHDIENSAGRITEIVSVIDSIASQTNLLALNAAVEAARAGEAGKGFAVVAAEVRTLASRCSEAARDVRGLITGSNAQVVEGVKLVTDTGGALRQIVESVNNVAQTIATISSASREQATGVEEISGAISQMDEMTQQNAALSDESAAAARSLAKEAEQLTKLITFFKTEGDSSGFKPRQSDFDGYGLQKTVQNLKQEKQSFSDISSVKPKDSAKSYVKETPAPKAEEVTPPKSAPAAGGIGTLAGIGHTIGGSGSADDWDDL